MPQVQLIDELVHVLVSTLEEVPSSPSRSEKRRGYRPCQHAATSSVSTSRTENRRVASVSVHRQSGGTSQFLNRTRYPQNQTESFDSGSSTVW